jgi:hypothetical protein
MLGVAGLIVAVHSPRQRLGSHGFLIPGPLASSRQRSLAAERLETAGPGVSQRSTAQADTGGRNKD